MCIRDRSERELQQLYRSLEQNLKERYSLRKTSDDRPLLLPLLLSLDRQIAALMPPLVHLQQRILATADRDNPTLERLNALSSIPDTVLTFLSSEDDTTLALSSWLVDHPPASLTFKELPTVQDVLLSLCRAPSDTSTQHWAEALLRRETPGNAHLMSKLMMTATGQKLMSLLEPRTLLRLARLGSIQTWSPPALNVQLPIGGVALILRGSCLQGGRCLATAATEPENPMMFLGLLDYLGGAGTSGTREGITASEHGLEALLFERRAFQELLDVAPVLEVEITRQLAWACGRDRTVQLH